MSFKSKDLSYSQNEPAFLRRIRGEIRGSVDDPDRQINPVARPTISNRLKKDEEDDAPTYVLEETNQDLSKEEYEAMLKGEETVAADASQKKTEAETEATNKLPTAASLPSIMNSKERFGDIVRLPKKRKAAKIIGLYDDDDDDEPSITKTQAGKEINSKGSKNPSKKKKGKAVKLSFGDDEP